MFDFNNKFVQLGVRAGVVAIGLLALFLLSKTITEIVSWSKDAIYPTKTISINAEGEAPAVADIASFSFSVSEEGQTSDEAQKKATDKINKAFEYFKTNGVEEKDIKTEDYSINPKYNMVAPCYAFDCPPAESKIIGYTVSQSIRVKVRDTDNAGKFLSELTKFEINQISGLSFTIDDEDVLYDYARKDAIEKAKAKASILAKSLGVKLGDVVSFSEDNTSLTDNYGYGGDARMEMAVKSSVPEIPKGENKYTSRVYVTYEIK